MLPSKVGWAWIQECGQINFFNESQDTNSYLNPTNGLPKDIIDHIKCYLYLETVVKKQTILYHINRKLPSELLFYEQLCSSNLFLADTYELKPGNVPWEFSFSCIKSNMRCHQIYIDEDQIRYNGWGASLFGDFFSILSQIFPGLEIVKTRVESSIMDRAGGIDIGELSEIIDTKINPNIIKSLSKSQIHRRDIGFYYDKLFISTIYGSALISHTNNIKITINLANPDESFEKCMALVNEAMRLYISAKYY